MNSSGNLSGSKFSTCCAATTVRRMNWQIRPWTKVLGKPHLRRQKRNAKSSSEWCAKAKSNYWMEIFPTALRCKYESGHVSSLICGCVQHNRERNEFVRFQVAVDQKTLAVFGYVVAESVGGRNRRPTM